MQKLKHYFAFLLVFSVFLSSIYINNLTVNASTVTTAYIEGTDVNVRKEPSTASNVQIIEKLSNTSVSVVDSVRNDEGLWYKVTYHNGTEQITGYIFYNEDYIRIVTYNPDASFEEKLKAFPEDYRDALRSLHSKYPNWEFIPDPVNLTFDEAVALQSVNMRKQVQVSSSTVSWRSMGPGSYDWSKKDWVNNNGGWTGASREIIAYYMDPRNFLNASDIYQFLQQSYSADQNEAGVRKIVAGTFLENGYTDKNDQNYSGKDAYVKVIMAAAKQSGVSPYIIAGKIIQEQGTKGTSCLISGTYKGYSNVYNFFNINASGKTEEAVIKNGLEYAKQQKWFTRSASIIGGAKFLSSGYISSGQDTYYYQDFNVHDPDNLWHQYAQAVHDAYNKGYAIADSYREEIGYALNFKIPIYSAMPEKISVKPEKSKKLNNYYFSSISVSGLTPSFSMFDYSYNLFVTGDTTVYVKPVDGATYAGRTSYSLKPGRNRVHLYAKSQTGYVTDYMILVNATINCTLTVTTTPPGTKPNNPTITPTVIRGDTNGDNKISLSDLANIRLHLLGLYTLKGNNATGADTNKDGKISLSDLANVRLHLLGLFTIKN